MAYGDPLVGATRVETTTASAGIGFGNSVGAASSFEVNLGASMLMDENDEEAMADYSFVFWQKSEAAKVGFGFAGRLNLSSDDFDFENDACCQRLLAGGDRHLRRLEGERAGVARLRDRSPALRNRSFSS